MQPKVGERFSGVAPKKRHK